MNRTPIGLVNAGLLAIALALSLAVVWQRNQRETWRQRIAEAEQQLQQSSRPSPQAGGTAATANATPAGPKAGGSALADVTATGASGGQDARGAKSARRTAMGGTSRASSTASTAKSPEEAERARIMAEYRRHLDELNTLNGYADGFVALQLPTATVERAKQIILDEQQAAARAIAALRSAEGANGQPDPETFRATLAQYQQSLQSQLSALLGEGAYEHLEAYHRQSGIDWTVGTDLWDAGVPLSGDQLHALAVAEVQTQYERQNPFEPETGSHAADPTTGLSSQDLALLGQSSHFLSAAQQDALRQSLIEDHQYNAAMAAFTANQHAAWQAARGGKH